MAETLLRPDQRTDETSIGGSPRARKWTLAVACMDVGVVASMTALNRPASIKIGRLVGRKFT
jgi:hypothetical protein